MAARVLVLLDIPANWREEFNSRWLSPALGTEREPGSGEEAAALFSQYLRWYLEHGDMVQVLDVMSVDAHGKLSSMSGTIQDTLIHWPDSPTERRALINELRED